MAKGSIEAKYWSSIYPETGRPGLRSRNSELVKDSLGQELRFLKEHQAYIERIDQGLKELMARHAAHPLHDPLT